MAKLITYKTNKKTGVYPESNYLYKKLIINEKNVAIVIDKDKGDYMSVTNNVENIANELQVDFLIYCDSMEIFDIWIKDVGYRSLSHQGQPTKELNKAIQIASICYIK